MSKRSSFFSLAAMTFRAGLSFGCVASLGATPSIAADQTRTGSLVPGGGGSSMVQESGRILDADLRKHSNPAAVRRAANEAHDTLRMFASCLVSGAATGRERRDLAAFLRTSPDDPSVMTRTNKIVRENCLNGVGAGSVLFKFQPDLLRGAIFRQLYLDIGRKPAPAILRSEISDAWSPDVSGALAANLRFGDCIVAADEQAADNLIRAKVASDRQDAALRDVMTRMSGCLTKGLTLQMSRAVLDGVLAEALYRKATASQDPAR